MAAHFTALYVFVILLWQVLPVRPAGVVWDCLAAGVGISVIVRGRPRATPAADGVPEGVSLGGRGLPVKQVRFSYKL